MNVLLQRYCCDSCTVVWYLKNGNITTMVALQYIGNNATGVEAAANGSV
jgi:hypothetical protein